MLSGIKRTSRKLGSSDYLSFVSLGIPAVQIGHEADRYYRTPQDTTEHIDGEKMRRVVSVLCEAVGSILSGDALALSNRDKPEWRPKKVYEIDLLAPMDFSSLDGSERTAFEQKHRITDTRQIPMRMYDPFDVRTRHRAWTDFIYGFQAYLSHTEIKMDEETALTAVRLLDARRTLVPDPERYTIIQNLLEVLANFK